MSVASGGRRNALPQGFRRIGLRDGTWPRSPHPASAKAAARFLSESGGIGPDAGTMRRARRASSPASPRRSNAELPGRGRNSPTSRPVVELFARVELCVLPPAQARIGGGIYSDLLLHDMRTDLADAGSYYGAIDTSSAESGQEPGVADAAALGVPRFRPVSPRRPGRDPGRSGRDARWPG